MKTLFGDNRKAVFVLTIRDPVDALESLLNFQMRSGQMGSMTGDVFVKHVLNRTKAETACVKEMRQGGYKYPSESLEAANYYDKHCLKHYALTTYNYPEILYRYSNAIGAGQIYCQFVSDLEEGKELNSRRGQLDLMGLHDIDEKQFFSMSAPAEVKRRARMKQRRRVVLTEDQRAELTSSYEKLYGAYDEYELRNLCRHSATSREVKDKSEFHSDGKVISIDYGEDEEELPIWKQGLNLKHQAPSAHILNIAEGKYTTSSSGSIIYS